MEFSKEEWMRHLELELNLNHEGDEDIKEFYKKVIDAYTDFPHDERTIYFTSSALYHLMKHENLSPITDHPSEWRVIGEGVWQNKRNPRMYSNDAGTTTILFPDFEENFDKSTVITSGFPDKIKDKWKEIEDL